MILRNYLCSRDDPQRVCSWGMERQRRGGMRQEDRQGGVGESLLDNPWVVTSSRFS